jgi:hypothetical protein
VAAAGLVLVALVAGVAVSAWQAVRAIRAEGDAVAGWAAESERAAGERKAWEEAVAAPETAKLANAQAQKRIVQIEKGNRIITAIFTDLDKRRVREGTEPLEALLEKRFVKAAGELEGEAVGDPLVATLQERLGSSLLNLGHPREAIPLFTKARATRTAEQGATHPDTLQSMNDLAFDYQDAGMMDLALPLWKETLRLGRDKLGADHPDTLQA